MKKQQSNLEVLRERAWRAQSRFQRALDEERDKVQRPILRRLIGKCFVYRNSYGSGESWPLYLRIVGFDEKKMTYLAASFQNCTDGRVDFRLHDEHNFQGQHRFGVESGWVPISLRAYNKAKHETWKAVEAILASAPPQEKPE